MRFRRPLRHDQLVTMRAATSTIPWAWYSDPAVLQHERQRIFRRAWQYAGRAAEVVEPGDYFAAVAGDIPVVVVRDRDGALRGFVNVCLHRGSELVEGAGNRATLQCPYHAWTYELDGTLRAAPRSEREAGFNPSELALVPVQAATWGPFVFVNPDPEARSLGEVLADLPARLAAGGIDVDRLSFRRRVEFELDANWKVVIENYLECYHCAVAHPGFSALVDVDPEAYTLEASEWFSSQTGALRDARPDRDDPYEARGDVRYGQFHFLWPNLRINVFPGPPNLSIGPALPLEPERTGGFFDYFFGEDVPGEVADELIAFDEQIGREDRALVERVQRGVRSGMLEHGRLLPDSEQLVRHFQQLVEGAVASPA